MRAASLEPPSRWRSSRRPALLLLLAAVLLSSFLLPARESWRILGEVAEMGPGGSTGEWVALEIVDTGPGIPPHEQERIFEEFYRVGSPDRSGAGLGLAISVSLARALGGTITVDSTVGSGSAFCLWLPVATHAPSWPEHPRRAETNAGATG